MRTVIERYAALSIYSFIAAVLMSTSIHDGAALAGRNDLLLHVRPRAFLPDIIISSSFDPIIYYVTACTDAAGLITGHPTS
eukprot:scaffold625602_cov18-Prasinocladus_malaysianus.AAC.1